ncbi:MAG TPA: phosphatase PAP2 family protein [Patescibacteria group bacterium]|nr:phosphatase PAP2 family protein [Patescibacteria group bacterium]
MAERKIQKKIAMLETKREVEAERAPNDSRNYWLASLVVGIVLLAVTSLLAHKHTLTGMNLSLFRHINDWPNSLRGTFLAITVAQNSLLIGAAAVVVSFVLKLYQLSWQLAAAIVGAGGAGLIMKKVIDEPRPHLMIGGVHQRAYEVDPGFPSGHVLVVTTVVLTLWPYLPRGWRWLVLTAIPLMALSRIYLGVHSPLDTIGGFALGLVVVSAMRVMPEILRKPLRLD